MPPVKEGCLERRFLRGGEVRASSGATPGIEGYSAVFGDTYEPWPGMVESLKPGTFARALQEKQDVRCLFNHNPDNVLGRTKAGTLELKEDGNGLYYVCSTDPNTRIAADVQSMIARRDVDGCSIGFVVRKQSWREEKNDDGNYTVYREIEDVDLYDVGPVTYPAYEGTSVSERSLWPNGVPAEVRSHVPGLNGKAEPAAAVMAPAEVKRAVTCDCTCDGCAAGNCDDCDCDGCDAENCSNDECRCGDGERSRMRMRLQLARNS